VPTVATEMSDDIHPILKIMRTYAFAYTANHDFDVLPTIMVDAYELRMGRHRIVGRDTDYRAATERQFNQFPGLGFTVHEVVSNGERIALRFSEHGRSNVRDADAVWGGISMYHWDASRLTSCLVEQDYFARRRQLESGVANPLESPAIDPWNVAVEPSSTLHEAVVREWALGGGIDLCATGTLDDEWSAPAQRYRLDVRETVFNDIFSAGSRVAFHVTQSGTLKDDGLGGPHTSSAVVTRHAAGIADVHVDVVKARIITDRLEIRRQLEERGPSQQSD
jgi:predicted ester cyclase